MAVSLIQKLWETDYRQWDGAVSDIEVCMLYKGTGSRTLPQNQRFIMLIAFGLRVVANIVARAHTSRGGEFSHCEGTVRVQIEALCLGPSSGAHSLH